MPFPMWLLDPHLFSQVSPAPPEPDSKSSQTSSASSSAPSKIAFLPPLNDKQGAQLSAIIQHFSAPNYTLPIAEGKTSRAPLSIREMMFLSRDQILKFLKVTGTTREAIARLERTLLWRRTTGIDDMDTHMAAVEEECRTGKAMVQGFGPSGMPVLYFFPSRNHIPIEQRKAIHLIWMLERSVDLMAGGVTKIVAIFVFGEKRQGAPTSLAIGRETIHYLMQHYPEIWGTVVLYRMSWAVRGFFGVMWPFIDPIVKAKMRIISGSSRISEKDVQRHALVRECGGDLEWSHEHNSYWPALINVCKKRRAEYERRFVALGPAIGIEERKYKFANLEDSWQYDLPDKNGSFVRTAADIYNIPAAHKTKTSMDSAAPSVSVEPGRAR
ncbi:CRAL/TRIO domain-containing protein [Cutaneotrichosporon oleaginosum]|uniref:CRAL/TRIO domain-containing protein n=1 Tax=Cutaneotrichosporon oleaginosum TaxID=879819 RepID=A0A0J0XSW4_9TREE|nr:CRAL/TRIO domain-containing protein [Cutaneotrichosporon oleaginosum]KLT44173.1 CRAL/TRIO domain-containing protein [Cutaneotrichosporon oleaginosum]